MSVNGLLAGLVAITAPCAFVDSTSAVIIGLLAGLLVCFATILLEKMKIDDPVGAVPVHLFNGIFGVICVGLFANGNPDTAAWNGIDTPVTGLFHGGGFGQLGAQLFEAGAIFLTVFILTWIFIRILNGFGLMRSNPKDEVLGLDIPEMGARGYWEGSHPNIRTPL
jgi:Amt family ammonium transporter